MPFVPVRPFAAVCPGCDGDALTGQAGGCEITPPFSQLNVFEAIMTIRNLSLLGSLFLSGLLTLGACGSSSSSGTGGTSGTCMSQTTGSLLTGTQTINSCYSNGVKSSDTITFDLSTGSGTGTSTYSKDGSVCFIETVAITGAAGAGGTETGTIKNGSGVAVATLTPNADGTLTVTCTGGSTYVINDSTCMPSGSSTAADCTDGICQ